MSELTACPVCGQTILEGYVSVEAPITLRFWFVAITRIVRVLYSSRCGFLRLIA